MNINKIGIEDFRIVNEFLLNNFSAPTHWPEWNLLISKYYSTDFYYFALIDNSELIGIFPVHEIKSGNLKILKSGQFHYIPNGGWLLKNERTLSLSKIPIPLNAIMECFALPELKEFGVRYSKFNRLFTTLIINLKNTEEVIWNKSVHSKRRNMIRKALKMGVIIQDDKKNLTDFYSLYCEANQQKRLDCLPYDYDYFSELIEMQNVNFEPLVAYFNGEPLAALGLIHDKNFAIYWIGATSLNAKNLGQGDLLQWEAIKTAKALGCKYYDLCYVEKDRLPRIYEFKRGFSQEEYYITYLKKVSLTRKVLNIYNKFITK